VLTLEVDGLGVAVSRCIVANRLHE